MSIKVFERILDPNAVWIDPRSGRPSREYYQYLRAVDARVRALIDGAPSVAFADLTNGLRNGELAFVTDGLKAGESSGSGTGVLAYWDGSNWIAVDSGAAVAN